MAAIWIEPLMTPPGGIGFPGGVAGGYALADSTNRSQTGLGAAVGSLARDASGNEYRLVKAGAAIAINEAVMPNAGLSDVRKTTAAANVAVLGVADAAFASGDFGWIMIRGSIVSKVVGATAINSLLVSGTGAAGTLQLAVATDLATRGVVQITAEAGGLATVQLL